MTLAKLTSITDSPSPPSHPLHETVGLLAASSLTGCCSHSVRRNRGSFMPSVIGLRTPTPPHVSARRIHSVALYSLDFVDVVYVSTALCPLRSWLKLLSTGTSEGSIKSILSSLHTGCSHDGFVTMTGMFVVCDVCGLWGFSPLWWKLNRNIWHLHGYISALSWSYSAGRQVSGIRRPWWEICITGWQPSISSERRRHLRRRGGGAATVPKHDWLMSDVGCKLIYSLCLWLRRIQESDRRRLEHAW